MKVVEGDIYDDTLKLHVIDLILKDVGTAGYTEYDWGTTLAEYFEENEDKWPVMFFSIHSHHTMAVSPSGTDDKHLYDNISNFPFHLSIIVNNRLDFNARIATDFIISEVSMRDMSSNYVPKKVAESKIIIEYSVPVSLGGKVEEDFEAEFNKVTQSKKKKYEDNTISKRVGGLPQIPFNSTDNKIISLNCYSLGTLLYDKPSIVEMLTSIKTPVDVSGYIDSIEKICWDYVEMNRAVSVDTALTSLISYINQHFSKHKYYEDLIDELKNIQQFVNEYLESEQDAEAEPSYSKKSIHTMTDKEWEDYVNYRL